MTESPKSLGQAIDEVIAALEGLPEPTQATAVRAACEHLGVRLASTSSLDAEAGGTSATTAVPTQPDPSTTSTQSAVDVRTLKEQKQPKGAVEMACIVAYYLESLAPASELKAAVVKADLQRYFKQANFRLPKRMEQVLVNAKNAGYLDSAGRGSYKLNPVGHNLVVHSLPRAKA